MLGTSAGKLIFSKAVRSYEDERNRLSHYPSSLLMVNDSLYNRFPIFNYKRTPTLGTSPGKLIFS